MRSYQRIVATVCLLPLVLGLSAPTTGATKFLGARPIVFFGDCLTQDCNWVTEMDCGLLAQGLDAEERLERAWVTFLEIV